MTYSLLNLAAIAPLTTMSGWLKEAAIRLNLDRKWLKKVAEIKVHVISHPKSGRTWLRVMLGKALCDHFGLDEQELLDIYRLTVLARVLPTELTHDRSEIKLGSEGHELESDKSFYRDKKVIFVVRDPRDVLVSTYFHATKRVGTLYGVDQEFGSIADFVRNQKYGIQKILAFYKIWADNQTVPQEFLLIRYEDLHQDAATCLRSVLKLIGVESVSEQTIARAVEFSQFENMKELERSDKFQSRMLKPANPDDADSYKVRRGKVGGYWDYLDAEDLSYIEQAMQQVGNPFGYG